MNLAGEFKLGLWLSEGEITKFTSGQLPVSGFSAIPSALSDPPGPAVALLSGNPRGHPQQQKIKAAGDACGHGSPLNGPGTLLEERESRGNEQQGIAGLNSSSTCAQGHHFTEKVWPELNSRLF